ncbi:MAG: ABC transporter permease [Bacteroidales bacterium]|nr:ABC transporter permease [Bacteroidales bacterium]
MSNPLFDIDNWREIGATLARNKTRTFLTAFGIFWGTAMLAMLWGGAGGLKGMLMRNFDGFATNMAVIFPGRTTMSYKGYNKGRSWDLTLDDVEKIRTHVTQIEHSTTNDGWWGTAAYGTKTFDASCSGVEASFVKINLPLMYEGRFISDVDVAKASKVIVLGKNVATTLFGTESALGKHVSFHGIYFTVIGVAGQQGEVSFNGRLDDSVVLPSSTLRNIANRGQNVGFLMFTVEKGHDPAELKDQIFRIIRSNHDIHPDDEQALNFFNVAEQFKMVDNLFLGVSLLAIFVGAGSLIAGIIGVGNIMWIIVKERTQEIGIRRALGAKPRDIIMQILSEGMVLTAVAGLAGISFATIALGVTDYMNIDPVHGSAGFALQLDHALVIMAVFLVLGTAAGLIPAIKAMRIKPIEAMNDK